MDRPFPGMDPWLEHPDLWPDVHNSLIAAIRDDLADRLAPRYVVRLEERVHRLSTDDIDQLSRPDLTITSAPGFAETIAAYSPAGAAEPPPVEVDVALGTR